MVIKADRPHPFLSVAALPSVHPQAPAGRQSAIVSVTPSGFCICVGILVRGLTAPAMAVSTLRALLNGTQGECRHAESVAPLRSGLRRVELLVPMWGDVPGMAD